MVAAAWLSIFSVMIDASFNSFVHHTLGLGLGFAQVYAFLFRVRLLTTVALDMGRPLLSFRSTVLALSNRSAFLGY